jgi:TetR/AcrR family transcriptional repressor of mexJK operon
VKAASEVFLAEGYERASLDQIAQRAGVSKQTIYSHFADKQDLFRAICTELTEKLTVPLGSAAQSRASLPDLLFQLAEDVLAMMCEPASLELHRLLLTAVSRFPELGETAFQAGANRMLDDVSQLLLQRSRVGEAGLAPLEAAQARRLAEQFVGMVAGFHQRRALLGVAPMEQAERRLYSRECVRLILRAA